MARLHPKPQHIYIGYGIVEIMTIRVSEIIEQIGRTQFGGGKKEIFDLIESTPDEVFCREDLHVSIRNYKKSSLNQYAEELIREGKIGKVRFGGRIYFGTKEAIGKIKIKAEAKKGEVNAKKK